MSHPYLQLISMADDELALAVAGRWDELPQAMEKRLRLAGELPATPPADAEPLLRRLTTLQGQLEKLLESARSEAARELAALLRSRGVVRSYAGAAPRGELLDGAA